MTLPPNRKLAATAVLFLIALITVALAAATTSYVPLFFTVFPLIGVAWVLSRDEPGNVPAATSAPANEAPAGTEGPGDPPD